MSTSSRDRVRQALDLLKEGLAPFVDRVMAERYGAEWRSRAPQNAARVASGWGPVPASDDLDTQGYLRVMLDNWHAAFLDKVGAFGLTLLHDLREMRNRWAHEDDLTAQDALRAYDTVGRLLLAIGASELAAKAARLHHEVILELAGASPPVAGAQVDAVPRQRVAPVARVARAVGDTGFWVTTHYPHPVPDNLPWYVYLKSATTARRLAVGDKVLFRDTEYCMLTKPTKRLVTRILCTQDGRITEVPLGPGTGC
ncbi:MAG: hypothetical protein HZB16_19150, partial [Armatimonadetes bacterium]|nr:hypothetical protein [Armatimonadota bacterium]